MPLVQNRSRKYGEEFAEKILSALTDLPLVLFPPEGSLYLAFLLVTPLLLTELVVQQLPVVHWRMALQKFLLFDYFRNSAPDCYQTLLNCFRRTTFLRNAGT